jgi:hypothetical protein
MRLRSLLTGLAVIICSASFAQSDYQQFVVVYVKPKLDKVDLFKKALSAHNKKYHSTGAYKARVFAVDGGPSSGAYAWVMGPTTWTQMDGAPGEGEHNADWEKNINPNLESAGETIYWRAVKDISYEPEGAPTMNKSRLRFSYVLPGQMDRFMEQMKKIIAVYKQKKYAASFSLATRQLASTGPHVVSFLGFSKWAYFDNGAVFAKDFDEVHGTGAYERFLSELTLCIDRAKSYDEFSTASPELGG